MDERIKALEKKIVVLEQQQEQLFLNAKIMSMQLGHAGSLLRQSYEEYLLTNKPINHTGSQCNCNI